ncbi:MAG: dihydroorotase [Bacteriovoracaceae bacterium]|jgi:dihydroorotase|nr:dihydroorotase [Bacteriovoracaceae bacterium]
MSSILVKNVLVKNELQNIYIENGLIKSIFKEAPNAKKVVEADGMNALPSLIDMQVHFREPGFEHKETIKSGSLSAVSGGFTTVAIMPNTSPTIDNEQTLIDVKRRIKESSNINIEIIPAMTKGLKGSEICDYKMYKEHGIHAITDDGKGVQDDDIMEQIFIEASKYDLSILQHCEVDSISDGGSIHEGTFSKDNNIKGIPSSSESMMIKRDIKLLKKHGGHYHVLHVSAKESIDLIKDAKKRGLNITCEVTPHHLLLCDEDIKNTNFKMNPPLRSKEDREVLQQAFLDGTIDMVSTDHAPHSIEEKDTSIEDAPFGIIGLESSFALLYTHFVMTKKCDLEYLIDRMSIMPAKVFNLHQNKIEVGNSANFILTNLQKEYTINAGTIYSKSLNTPFLGHKVYAMPIYTIKDGEIIYAR